MSEIPHRINSTNLFTSKGDDFDKLVLSLTSLTQCDFQPLITAVNIDGNEFELALSQELAEELVIHAFITRQAG